MNSLKTLLQRASRAFGVDVIGYSPGYSERCISLAADRDVPFRGNVLLSYILEPFLTPNEPISTTHNNRLESVLIAQAFRDLGYAVDVIDFRNDQFVPRKRYAFFVSARTHLATIAKRLNPDCIKIAHLDTAHFLFNNAATFARALALQQRRGVTSSSLRVVEYNLAIENCDYAAVLGGEFCMETYRYAGKPLYRLPVPMLRELPIDPAKDYDVCRNRFLWFGSFGFVHKGLDLTLEAFAQMPALQLEVCGRLEQEKEFGRVYRRELYETPNIRPVGWVDVGAQSFEDVANRCVAVVFPSCAESESCSVLTCMQAGLIPVVTREAGIDVQDFGIMLPDASITAIQEAVQHLAGLPARRLREMSRKAWEYTCANHSPKRYASLYKEMIANILNKRSSAT